jgi:hypothetical protein
MKKEIELKKEDFGEEFAGQYVFESIAWGTANQISSDCTKIDPITRRSSINLRELQGRMLDATMTVKPKSITLDRLTAKDGIPVALGEFLISVADQVNGYSDEDRDRIKKLRQRCGLD